MSNTYIKFAFSKNDSQKKPENIGRRLISPVFTEEIPIANPDFIGIIEKVSTWLIEFEADSYFANREIGLDNAGQPIVIMPWKNNYGYWVDNDLVIQNFKTHFDFVEISKNEFDVAWKLFESTH